MNLEDLSKDRQIMLVMRKVLTTIIRETTPPPGMIHPLSAATIEDMRLALSLISARERELMEAEGIDNQARPHFTDEPQAVKTVSLDSLKRG
jgi:hypothetical protein